MRSTYLNYLRYDNFPGCSNFTRFVAHYSIVLTEMLNVKVHGVLSFATPFVQFNFGPL